MFTRKFLVFLAGFAFYQIGYACPTPPTLINIQNSPFGIKQFSVSPSSVSYVSSDGKRTTIQCGKGANNWSVNDGTQDYKYSDLKGELLAADDSSKSSGVAYFTVSNTEKTGNLMFHTLDRAERDRLRESDQDVKLSNPKLMRRTAKFQFICKKDGERNNKMVVLIRNKNNKPVFHFTKRGGFTRALSLSSESAKKGPGVNVDVESDQLQRVEANGCQAPKFLNKVGQ